MSRYEERLAADLDGIRSRVCEAGRYAQRAVGDAVRALLARDQKLAFDTILRDLALNRDIRELDRRCHAFIARHLPSAGHLRFVSSVLRINVAIERIGDYAVTVARECAQLSAEPPDELARDLRVMCDQSRLTLAQAIDAFESGNAELARGTIAAAKQVDTTLEAVFGDLVEAGDERQRPLADVFALLVSLNRLERVADQAKNICEETIFVETGETKAPKSYRVLFADADNACLGVMAEAIARKAFPESGQYASAGWEPARELDPGFVAFMNRHGHAVEDHVPRALASMGSEIDDLHVVVGIGGDPQAHIESLAYRTIIQRWDAPEIPAGLDRERADALLEDAYKALSLQVEDLMIALRGAGAN